MSTQEIEAHWVEVDHRDAEVEIAEWIGRPMADAPRDGTIIAVRYNVHHDSYSDAWDDEETHASVWIPPQKRDPHSPVEPSPDGDFAPYWWKNPTPIDIAFYNPIDWMPMPDGWHPSPR